METFFSFSGQGTLSAPNGSTFPCQFEASQKAEGGILVSCSLSEPNLSALIDAVSRIGDNTGFFWNDLRTASFDGVTEDGSVLNLDQIDLVSTRSNTEVIIRVASARLEHICDKPPSHMVVQLVNFGIWGEFIQNVSLPSGFPLSGNLMPLRLPKGQALLRAVEGHQEQLKELASVGGIGVTTELYIPLNEALNEEAAEQVTHDLCCVLTLLSGNRVNWVSYQVCAADGTPLCVRAQNAVTRPFRRTNLINTLSDRNCAYSVATVTLCPIIERMMERFEVAEKKWNIVAIINSFHEALASKHFTEQRGQLLATCMEMVRQSYANRGDDEFILPHEHFDRQSGQLKDAVNSLLLLAFSYEEGWDKQKQKEHRGKLLEMAMHVRGINRYGFKHIMGRIADELGLFSQGVVESQLSADENADFKLHGFLAPLCLDATSKQIEKAKSPDRQKERSASIKVFVEIRDQLTHQGHFLVPEVDTSTGWTSEKVNEERWSQVRFMERFVGVILATILGWHQPLPTHPTLHRH